MRIFTLYLSLRPETFFEKKKKNSSEMYLRYFNEKQTVEVGGLYEDQDEFASPARSSTDFFS